MHLRELQTAFRRLVSAGALAFAILLGLLLTGLLRAALATVGSNKSVNTDVLQFLQVLFAGIALMVNVFLDWAIQNLLFFEVSLRRCCPLSSCRGQSHKTVTSRLRSEVATTVSARLLNFVVQVCILAVSQLAFSPSQSLLLVYFSNVGAFGPSVLY